MVELSRIIYLAKNNNKLFHRLSRGPERYSAAHIDIEFEELGNTKEVDDIEVVIPMQLIRYWLGHHEGGLANKTMPHLDLEDAQGDFPIWTKERFYTSQDDEWVSWFLWWLMEHYQSYERTTIKFRATHIYWMFHDLTHAYEDTNEKGAKTLTVEQEHYRHTQAFALCMLYNIAIEKAYLDEISALFERHFDYPIKYDQVTLKPVG